MAELARARRHSRRRAELRHGSQHGRHRHELTTHPAIRKITFTGSTAVGKEADGAIGRNAQKAVSGVGRQCAFHRVRRRGPRCGGRRMYREQVSQHRPNLCLCQPDSRAQCGLRAVHHKLTEAVSQLRVGDGLEGPTDQGPLIDAAALAKVQEHVADARRRVDGSSWWLAMPGREFLRADHRCRGNSPDAPRTRGDFRTGGAAVRFNTEAEAIGMANDTEFGLAAYFYTRDLARSWRVAEALECGMVGLNTGFISTEVAPFGGIKESGMGREGSRSRNSRLTGAQVRLRGWCGLEHLVLYCRLRRAEPQHGERGEQRRNDRQEKGRPARPANGNYPSCP